MERKIPFEIGETYHLYTRGVEKRVVFLEKIDSDRFLANLFLCNSDAGIHIGNTLAKYRGEPSMNARLFSEVDRGTPLTSILAYSLMPNHIHLVVKERTEGGISKFMLKLMTAYSMYFNIKHERSGPLFTRPFRSKHVDSDEYFRWLFAYIHLNPLDLHQSGWREQGIRNLAGAHDFINTYSYSSYLDYAKHDRDQKSILEQDALPIELDSFSGINEMLNVFDEFRESVHQTKPHFHSSAVFA